MHDQKYQKSARRTYAVLLPNHWRRARVSRASHAWQVCAALVNGASQQFRAHHNLDHTTRANISHEEAEQIRARIACTPAESAGIDRFAKQTRSASPRQGKRAWGSLYADEIRAFCHPELSSLSLKSAIKEKYL